MTSRELSYVHGGSETPLIYQTIGARFDQAAALWPDRQAFVVCDQGVRLTFAEMKREVDRLAAGLLALSLQPGDRVGIWSPNNAAWVLTQYSRSASSDRGRAEAGRRGPMFLPSVLCPRPSRSSASPTPAWLAPRRPLRRPACRAPSPTLPSWSRHQRSTLSPSR
jgi:hypothetical protein